MGWDGWVEARWVQRGIMVDTRGVCTNKLDSSHLDTDKLTLAKLWWIRVWVDPDHHHIM
jgi:hypothetical protein